MPDKLDEYIREHLEKYIKYHLERGYDITAVKKALTSYGYTLKEINQIADKINITSIKTDDYDPKDLDGDTYYYLRGMLADYIKRQRNHGFELKDIRKALIKYGHNKDIVDDAINMTRSQGSLNINPTFVILISFIISLLFIFIMLGMLQVSFVDMFLVFTPALITMVLLYGVMPFLWKKKEAVPILAIILTGVLFFFIFPAIANPEADVNILLVLNIVLAFIFTGLHAMSYKPRK